MGINHIKFDEIDSTQTWLKENISKYLGQNTLVTTRFQSNGIGRMGNVWEHFGNSIAFSFNLNPSVPLTLTPLEIGVHIINFFKAMEIELLLKWPNDILIKDEGFKKVGGIICHYVDSDTMIVGIGLNLDKEAIPTNSKFKFSPAALSTSFLGQDNFFHLVPHQIVNYILSKRLSAKEIAEQWSLNCAHLNSMVKIVDDNKTTEGVFKGLGENGEALIAIESSIEKVVSGSLWIL